MISLLLTACMIGDAERPATDHASDARISSPIAVFQEPFPSSDQDLVALLLTPSESLEGGEVRYRYSWFRDGEELTAYADVERVPSEETAPGQSWRLEVVGYQSDLESAPAEAYAMIENTAPVIEIELTPATPGSTDDLVVEVVADDVDGDELVLAYAWYRDGVLDEDYVDAVLPADATDRQETWSVEVTVEDQHGSGSSAWASATVENTAPTLTGVVISPNPAYEGDILTCTPVGFEDADGDAPAYKYQWTLDDGEESCNCHAAEPDPELSGSFASVGYRISCEATPTDGDLSGATIYSAEVEILQAPPDPPDIQIEPKPAYAGDTLTVAFGGFGADDALTYDYLWLEDGVEAGTADTVDGSEVQAGEVWTVSVTASNDDSTSEPGVDSVVIEE